MKYLVFIILILAVCVSCKKENYGYSCSCTQNSNGAVDTNFTLRVETSGEANYLCKDYEDTATFYGKDVKCILE